MKSILKRIYSYIKKINFIFEFGSMWYVIGKPFRRIWRYLCTLFSYAKFLWNYHCDWDYSVLLQLFRFQLVRMEKHFKGPNCYIVRGEEMAQEMQEAINRLSQIIDDDFIEEEHEAFEKKWGKLVFKYDPKSKGSTLTRCNVFTPEDEKQEAEEAILMFELEEKRIQEAYSQLFSQIACRIRLWWD